MAWTENRWEPRPTIQERCWVYGFMTGVRSSRKLEAACRDQIPYWWLSGCQQPDHNPPGRMAVLPGAPRGGADVVDTDSAPLTL